MMMTAAMKRAERWLSDRGGSGILDRYGRMVARGEVATQYDASTWLRLVATGHVQASGGRFILFTIGCPPHKMSAAPEHT